MSVLPGDPIRLRQGVRAYAALASELEGAARALRAIAVGGESAALDAIRASAAAGPRLLDAAQMRFVGAAIALDEYTVVLERAQIRAHDAAATERRCEAELAVARADLAQLDLSIHSLDAIGVAPAFASADLRVARDDCSRRIAALEVACASATLEVVGAAEDIATAGAVAVARIDSSPLLASDRGPVGGAAGMRELLPELWDAFVEGFATVAAAVGAAIASAQTATLGLVTIVAVAVATSSVLGFAGGSLALGALGATSMASSPIGWLVSCAVLILAQFAVLAVAERAEADAAKPTPALVPFAPPPVGSPEWEAWELARHQVELDGVDDFMRAAGYVDRMGGDRDGVADERTVVDIKSLGDEPPHWVVTLPSTQDWQALSVAFGGRGSLVDSGAVNDLDSNLAMMLYPELETQYERAVLEAMRRAGIASTDPVMLVGFSQGGILAGHLAAHRTEAFNFTAVLAYGAPIDAMPIPATSHTGAPVSVVSIQHAGDLVHELDLTRPPSDLGHWSTYSVPAPSFLEQESAHNNDRYTRTAQGLLGDLGGVDVSVPTQPNRLDTVFRAFSGRVRTHQQYEFAEERA